MSNNMGTQNASVYWTGYEIHSCLKIWATKISCVLDKGYNSGWGSAPPEGPCGSTGLCRASNAQPYDEIPKCRDFYAGLILLPVGACIAGPPTVRGDILGFADTANAGRASPAPTVKSRNNAYNFTNSLTAHSRGGALLHPKSLAGSQGFANQALLAPTIESQKSDIFLRKPCLLLVGACTAGPLWVRGRFFSLQARQTRAEQALPLL